MTRFGALAHAPDGWLSRTGARRFAYAESHWFGNPGGYQVYVLGYNDAGTGHYEMPPPLTIGAAANAPQVSGGRLCPETGSRPSWDQLPGWLQPPRDKTTVNTLTVLGPGGDVAITQGWPGVDGDLVRLLRQAFTNREIRQRRRAHRRAMRRATAPAPELADDLDPVPERSDD